VVDAGGDLQVEPDLRVAEARQKRWLADYLAELAANAGLADTAQLGSQLLLIIDGASSRVLVEAGADPAAGPVTEIVAQARRAAEVLIAHAGEAARAASLDQ
jgi:hypothetical protein